MNEQPYLEQAQRQGLKEPWSTVGLQLSLKHPDPAHLSQVPNDLVEAYYRARTLSAAFRERVQTFAERVGGVAGVRPDGIKSLERSMEKVYFSRRIPLDLLAGKVVFERLDDLYRAAEYLASPSGLSIAAFRDRFVWPQRSGYRDVQFIVALGEEFKAELKLVLRPFDELDAYEHRVYEVLRTLEGQLEDELSEVQLLVLETLGAASQTMYQNVWAACLKREGG